MVSHQLEVATARNIFARGRDLIVRQLNLPLQRTAAVLVQGKYARRSSKYFRGEEGTSIDAAEIVAVLEQDTPVAMAESK